MPAVRDISWTFESTTSDAGIVVPIPAYEENDLLLAFIQGDTGSGVITATNWTQVFARTNTTRYVCLSKIATASESDVTFASTVSETYNGCIISIRDVDTTTPINAFNDTTQVAAAKYTFQTITTTKHNCLLIYAAANSGVGVPSIIEGPVTGILGADGAAESQGIGWSAQPTSGTTPNNVTCSNVASGAGVKAVLAINPPSAGATELPTYCAGDNSIYVNPINGVTAYNGDAALAATFDTLFTTTLNGVTAGDATVAAAADTGLNSFHSTGRLTTISGSKNWSGAALDLAGGNVLNTTGKNVLVHTAPSTSGQIQRFPSVSTAKKGIGFGMLSTAGNWKMWYVHGAGTSWGQSIDVPLVINSDNTSGILQTTGTFNPASTDVFGFVASSLGVSTTVWQFYSLWVLDTTTIAGGLSTSPVDIAGIVTAAASGHERRSVIQQGANQALILQPIQFGDGGTNKIYLDLNATAIEFPKIHDLISKQIFYCSVDNVAGLTYYAGAADTIKHRNSIISSSSPYHWRIHASSSASASYDFSGLSIIGAGDVQLRAVTTFLNMTFDTCGQIVQNGALIDSCTVTTSTASVALLSNDPENISDTNFVSDGTGHAIEISVAGTYSFVGNQFSGYAGSNGTTGNEAIYNNSGGAVTLNITGGGNTPSIRNGAGASTTVNANVQVTLSGLVNPSEVRVFLAGTSTAIDGQENVTTGSFIFSVGSGVGVDISILALNYQIQRIKGYSTTSDAILPIQQIIDRQYANT
jgi:hypothetical protein